MMKSPKVAEQENKNTRGPSLSWQYDHQATTTELRPPSYNHPATTTQLRPLSYDHPAKSFQLWPPSYDNWAITTELQLLAFTIFNAVIRRNYASSYLFTIETSSSQVLAYLCTCVKTQHHHQGKYSYDCTSTFCSPTRQDMLMFLKCICK